MKVTLLDTYGELTHASLALTYLEGFALQDSALQQILEIQILSLPVSRLQHFSTKVSSAFDLFEEILAFRPDIIGLSSYVWNLKEFLYFSGILKTLLPQSTIILGGPEVSSPSMARKILKDVRLISFIIMGEGEIPFRNLLRHWAKPEEPLEKVPGLAYCRHGGEVACNPWASVENLDEIPSPFLGGKISLASELILLETYRGCPNRCNYCTWSNQKMRYFPLKRLFQELAGLINSSVQNIYIIDPIFGPGKGRAHRILDHVIEQAYEAEHLPGFFVFPNVDHFDDKMAQKLRQGNCTIGFGLQSTNPLTLTKANRALNPDKFKTTLKVANKYFPKYDVDLIYGLPGDTMADFKNSFNWLVRWNPPEIHSPPLSVLPGSVFYEKAAEVGLEFEPWPPHRVLATSTLTRDEIHQLEKFSGGVYIFYNCASITFRYLQSLKGTTGAALIDDFLDWVELTVIQPGQVSVDHAIASPEDIFFILGNYLRDKFSNQNNHQKQAVLATLAFDRVCYICFKQFILNPPQKTTIFKEGEREADPLKILAANHGPMHLIALPQAVSDFVDNKSKSDSDTWAHQNSYYLVHRLGFLKVEVWTKDMMLAAKRKQKSKFKKSITHLNFSRTEIKDLYGFLTRSFDNQTLVFDEENEAFL